MNDLPYSAMIEQFRDLSDTSPTFFNDASLPLPAHTHSGLLVLP